MCSRNPVRVEESATFFVDFTKNWIILMTSKLMIVGELKVGVPSQIRTVNVSH